MAEQDPLLTSRVADENEVAAGTTRIPEVVVYEHRRYGGREWRTNLSYLYVGDWWNDKISSIIVVSGTVAVL